MGQNLAKNWKLNRGHFKIRINSEHLSFAQLGTLPNYMNKLRNFKCLYGANLCL